MRQRRQFDNYRVIRLHRAACKNDGHDAGLANKFAIGRAIQHSIEKPGLEILYLGARVAQARCFQNDLVANSDQSALRQPQQIDPARGDVLAKICGRDIKTLFRKLVEKLGMNEMHLPQIGLRRIGPHNSYLIEITAKVLKATDPETGKAMVDMILDEAGQKGTGRWAAIEAQMLGVPATAIEAAVAARSLSSLKATRELAAKAYKPGSRSLDISDQAKFLADLEQGLLAGKIAAYAQGFAVMEAASQEHGWNIPLAETARIWRAGCIIRSQLLDDIAHAFEDSESRNLLLAPAFVERMSKASKGLRQIVAKAALAGLPLPALGSALSYFDSFTQALGTANLIQGQRDFFGSHGFKRIDKDGDFHGPWG